VLGHKKYEVLNALNQRQGRADFWQDALAFAIGSALSKKAPPAEKK
jgi:hypothetical protein